MYATIGSIRGTPVKENFQPNQVRVYNAPKTEPETRAKHVTPEVWGKPLWFSLHHGALHYPPNPSDVIQKNMLNFIIGLPSIIPCSICREHATQYINNAKSTLQDVVSSPDKLFRFFWEFHNSVNERTRKRMFSYEEVYELYKNRPTDALL